MAHELDVARRKMLRLVLRICWRKDCVDWPEYLQLAAEKIANFDSWYRLVPWSLQAKARKWRFAGALARCDDDRWSHIILDWHPIHGKRSVGRPVTRWCDEIIEYAGDDWIALAKDQDSWEDHCSGF